MSKLRFGNNNITLVNSGSLNFESGSVSASIYINEGGQLQFKNQGTNAVDFNTLVEGRQGPQGPAGARGSQGLRGPKGEQGNPGQQGPQGPSGQGAGVQGPKGDTGATGAQGATGPQGPKGDTGATGVQGARGIDGISGPQGATGAQGPQGAAGQNGAQGATGPSTGIAAGDLDGNFPNPNVKAIRGNAVSNATLGQQDNGKALVWNGTQWAATSVPSISPTSANSISLVQVPSGDINLQQWIDTQWSPLDIPGLQLWFDSNVGITLDINGKVESWRDRSPAGRLLVQPTAANRPNILQATEGFGDAPVVSVRSWNQRMHIEPPNNNLGLSENGITIVTVIKSTARARTNGQLLISHTDYPFVQGTINTGWSFYLAQPGHTEQNHTSFITAKASGAGIVFQGNDVIDGNWHVLTNCINHANKTSFYEQNRFGGPLRDNSDGSWNPQEVPTAMDFDDLKIGDPSNYRFVMFGMNNYGSGNSSVDIDNVDMRFYFQFNRELTRVELEKLTSWIEKEMKKTSGTHTKVSDREQVLYVSSSGNDANHGRHYKSQIKTLNEALERFKDVPTRANGLVNSFQIGDGHGVPSKFIEIGPGTYRIPSIEGVHSTQIRGTIAIEDNRTILSVQRTGHLSVGPIIVTIDGSTLQNDAWRGRLLQFNNADEPTYRRLIVSKNVGNVLYCAAERPGEIYEAGLLTPGQTLGLIKHLTTLEYSFDRFQFISNCWDLKFVDVILTGVKFFKGNPYTIGSTDYNNTQPYNYDSPMLNITGGSQVVVVGVEWRDLNLCCRNGGILYLRRSYFAPHGGGYNQGFWQICRHTGILEMEGVAVDGVLGTQVIFYGSTPSGYGGISHRFVVASNSLLNLRAGNTWREMMGVDITSSKVVYNPQGGHWNWFDETAYAFRLEDCSPSYLGPIYRTNVVGAPAGADWNWDIWASKGSKVMANTALMSSTTPQDIQEAKAPYTIFPAGWAQQYRLSLENDVYRTSTNGDIFGRYDSKATEGSTYFDGSCIISDDLLTVPASPRKKVALNLKNGWSNAGGNYDDASISKDVTGRVSLSGAVTGGNNHTVISTLTTGLYPDKTHVFSVPTSSGVAAIAVQSDGDVYILSTPGGTIFLDSISWIKY